MGMFPQQPASNPPKKSFSHYFSLYAGDIPSDLTDDQLFRHFKNNDFNVASVRVFKDQFTQKARYAFVNFYKKNDGMVSVLICS
jgi:RNA recognition motif-containing protein